MRFLSKLARLAPFGLLRNPDSREISRFISERSVPLQEASRPGEFRRLRDGGTIEFRRLYEPSDFPATFEGELGTREVPGVVLGRVHEGFLLGQNAIPFDSQGRMIAGAARRLRKCFGRHAAANQPALRLLRDPGSLSRIRVRRRLRRAVSLVVSTRRCYYYHWLVDSLPILFAASQATNDAVEAPTVVLQHDAAPFVHRTIEFFGFGDWDFISPEANDAIAVEDLWVIDLGHCERVRSPFALQPLREAAWAQTSARCEEPPLRLIVARSARDGRLMTNLPEIERHLHPRGFTTIRPEEHSFAEQICLFARAEIVVATHGSALANLLWCRDGARVIECFGALRSPCYYRLAQSFGFEYSALCCESDSEDPGGNFEVPVARLLQLLDQPGAVEADSSAVPGSRGFAHK